MEPKMKLGDYLVAYLKKIGVSHLFGIPGDLVIAICSPSSVRRARAQGHYIVARPSAWVLPPMVTRVQPPHPRHRVTYGAGRHNMVNPGGRVADVHGHRRHDRCERPLAAKRQVHSRVREKSPA